MSEPTREQARQLNERALNLIGKVMEKHTLAVLQGVWEELDTRDKQYLSAVKGRQDFRRAFKDQRAEVAALRARVAELEGDLNVTRLQLGARVCSECPARARVAELEARLKTPYCACSWDANDNVVGLCGAHAAKVETLRDAVLNDRGFLAEAGMTSDQTNAVLATIDALWPTLFSDGLPANKPAQQKGDV